MTPNEQLIHTFYTAFQNKDYRTMQSCYADDATFTDPVFENLYAVQVRAMWEMFCRRGKDLELEYRNVTADETTGSAEWIATYSFSATGKKVQNHIFADFTFENGKIVRHEDRFDFYKWTRQALGLRGWLLGWTGLVRRKVQQGGMKNLADFMRGGQTRPSAN